MKQLFTTIGIIGIIATILTGLTSFSNTTRDFAMPFIIVGILLSIIIIEIGICFSKKGEKDDTKDEK